MTTKRIATWGVTMLLAALCALTPLATAQAATRSSANAHIVHVMRPLTNQVYGISCADRTDFYTFYDTNWNKYCFANSGSVSTYGQVNNIQIMNTGNNVGSFYYVIAGGSQHGCQTTGSTYTAYLPPSGELWVVTTVYIGSTHLHCS